MASIDEYRPSLTARPTLDKLRNSQSHAQLKSVTPRVKSQGTLNGNASNSFSRHSKQSGLNKQISSAAARRVAYDARRKVAFQSMKAMTKTNQVSSSQINRQAREAV